MTADEIEQQAAHWLSRQDRGLDAAEALALDRWLGADTLNRVAYLRLYATWRRVDRLSALKGLAASRSRQWRRSAAFAAAATILILVVTSALWWRYRPVAQIYATNVGQFKEVLLADGTRVQLNTSTQLHTEVTKARRVVTLESGEAYFDVVHDASRPFTVYAGKRRITDLGTKFSVFRNGDDVRVTVREGRVKVDMLDHQALDTPVVAQAGHVVVAKGSEVLVLSESDRNIDNSLSWRNGMLVFSQQTLGEAADQFNRYNSKKIVVEGAARRIRIGGSFKVNNVEVFVQLLHRGFGVSVDDQGKRIVISR